MHTFVKAHTHRPIFRGFVAESGVESADSIPELADYTTDSVIVGGLPLSNMFLNALESDDWNQPNIGVGLRQIGLVGMGLYSPCAFFPPQTIFYINQNRSSTPFRTMGVMRINPY